MNERMNEWDLTVFTHCLLGILVFFFHTPSGIPLLFQLLTKLGWRQEIEWFPANDLSARGNETRIRSKNPLGKLGYHIGVKPRMKSHSQMSPNVFDSLNEIFYHNSWKNWVRFQVGFGSNVVRQLDETCFAYKARELFP